MYRNGSIVTLSTSKVYNDGEDDVRLTQGTCGMVVQVRRGIPGQEQGYVVEFGAYGQVNCLDSELNGDSQSHVEEDQEYEILSPRISVIPEEIHEPNVQVDGSGEGEEKRKGIDLPGINFERDLAIRISQLEKEIL